MVSQVTRPFMLSEDSELVMITFSSNSYYSAHLVEETKCQYQQFFKMLADKGVSVEAITKFIQLSAGCIPILHYYISELLSSIAVVINDAEKVLAIRNTHKMLPVLIGQALMMSVC